MELALMAESDSALFGRHKPLQLLASILDETEASRGSIRLKFLLTKVVLGSETYDKGSQPYQDFDILFAVRDAIIHMKPEKITGEPHKILQRLRANDLCEAVKPGVAASWLGQISGCITRRTLGAPSSYHSRNVDRPHGNDCFGCPPRYGRG